MWEEASEPQGPGPVSTGDQGLQAIGHLERPWARGILRASVSVRQR